MKTLLLSLCLFATAHAGVFTDKALNRDAMVKTITGAGVPADRMPSFGAPLYAEVKRSELIIFQALFSHLLSQRGLPVGAGRSGHQKRFNCLSFCQAFVVEANLTLTLEMFYSWSGVERAAIIPVAYTPDNGGCHAILLILTDAGAVWWDPQAGEHPKLTPTELKTIWFPQA